MDLMKSLEVFIKVAELSSFSNAADDLGMPKSAISTYVSSLERDLGARLFLRTTRKVILTNEGREFYQKAEKLLFEADELKAFFKDEKEKVSGILRIDMPVGMARKLVFPKLNEFLDKFPNLRFEISSTDRMVDVLYEGFDAVIRIGGEVGNIYGHKLIGNKPVVNCISPNYAEKYGIPTSIKDLHNHMIINYSLDFSQPNPVFEYLDGKEAKQVRLMSKVTVNNSISYISACLVGQGICQTPYRGVKEYIDNGQLIRILSDFEPAPLPIYFISPQKRNIPRRTIAFLDWIEGMMGEYCALPK